MNRQEENALLTMTGPGTGCGALLRRYWQPVGLARDLKDGVPVPVKILGEDLVLFRDDRGEIGLIGLHCPHRCADLSYGRLEDGGLRCLYHGWLIDRYGRCLDQPAEPPESGLKDRIRHTAYRCHEAAGTIFAYMGPGAPPRFPNFHFVNAPPEHVYQSRVRHRCNYLQANEGNIDPAHLSFLHAFAKPLPDRKGDYGASQDVLIRDPQPDLEIERTRFGVRIYASRGAPDGRTYLRVTNYVFPNLAFFAGSDQRYGEGGYSVHWHVPIDDTSHWRYEFYYHPHHALDKVSLVKKAAGEVDENEDPVRGAHNRYRQDRRSMGGAYSGMGDVFFAHDTFAVESPGPIHDRSRERLGTTDMAIVAARRMMLAAIDALARGELPPLDLRTEADNQFWDLVVLSRMLPSGENHQTHCADLIARSDFHACAK